MLALTAEDFADLRRWVIAGSVVVLAHGGIAVAMVRWHDPVFDTPDPTGAVVVELAPEQVAAPEQVQSDAVPEKPIEKVEKVEKEPEPVEEKAELPVEQKVEPKPPEEQPRDPSPLTTPPPELPKIAALPAAPVQGTPTKPVDPKVMQMWVGEIAAAIERKKRYPAAAHARREQGTVQVAFTLDQHGHVIESHIERSSGAADLDAEALALVNRAQPFPPGPARGSADELAHLTVPVRFSLK
jgi:periplasmic protein TonB